MACRLSGSACGDGALHQEGCDLGVHLLDQLLEQLVRLKLVDEERVLLLKTCVLNIAAQVVHVAKVFLPVLVDDGEHNGLFHGVEHAFALGEHTLFDVRPNLEGLAAVAERHQNVFVIVLGVVVDALDDRMGALARSASLVWYNSSARR